MTSSQQLSAKDFAIFCCLNSSMRLSVYRCCCVKWREWHLSQNRVSRLRRCAIWLPCTCTCMHMVTSSSPQQQVRADINRDWFIWWRKLKTAIHQRIDRHLLMRHMTYCTHDNGTNTDRSCSKQRKWRPQNKQRKLIPAPVVTMLQFNCCARYLI